MFTGIITAVGHIKSTQAKGDGMHLVIEVPAGYLDDVALGDSIAIQGGWLNINDIHRLEDLPPVEGGDVYRVPLSNVDLAAADLVAQEKQTSMAAKLIQVGFAPEEVIAALGLPAMSHTGIPNVQLQPLQNLDPTDPLGAYEA